MTVKTDEQRFVFLDGGYQDFPNKTDRECVIVDKAVTLSGKKIVGVELVNKTSEDLAVEKQVESDVLDLQYKAQRKVAEMSHELTIFQDSTLSAMQKNDIKRVRQEWKDMTAQINYPIDFAVPELNKTLFP